MYFELDQSDQKKKTRLFMIFFLLSRACKYQTKVVQVHFLMFWLPLCALRFEPLELDPESITFFMVNI